MVSDSKVILADEQQYQAKLAALRRAIDEGDASGVAEGDVFARVRETFNLPPAN
jgi:antitoxin ParD1/3/4